MKGIELNPVIRGALAVTLGVTAACSKRESEVPATLDPVTARIGTLVAGNAVLETQPAQQDLPTPQETLTPIESSAEQVADGAGTYTLTGVPESVDPSIVLRAKGPDGFGNDFRGETLEGVGGNLIFADPGAILVGPEHPKDKVDASGGSTEYLNEVNHDVVHSPEEFFNLAEGRFLVFSGGQFELKLGKLNEALYDIKVDGKEGHNWFVAIRGLHPDGSTPEDRNWTVELTTVNPGHVEWQDYPHAAYISEDHFLQRVDTAHDGTRNCGYEGCPGVTIIVIDANNGSYSVMHQTQKGAEWEFVASNWFTGAR